MTEPARLDRMCALLTERYGAAGGDAGARLRRWIGGGIPHAEPEILARHLDEPHAGLVFDAFRQVLPFGTGGRRGPMGYGANRMNPATVAMTVQGHANYLRERADGAALSVVVANDVRVFADNAGVYRFLGPRHPLLGVSSRALARLACAIYAGNGIVAWLAEPRDDRAVTSTPELSFYIVQLGAAGGVNLSASHNPPDDNGIKVYDAYGSQPVAPEDQRLVDTMDQATAVRTVPFEEALRAELIRPLPRDLRSAYVDTYVELYRNLYPAHAGAPAFDAPAPMDEPETRSGHPAGAGAPVNAPAPTDESEARTGDPAHAGAPDDAPASADGSGAGAGDPARAGAPVVYTPLCGCGVHTVKPVLERLGFPVLMPPDQGLDGTFAAIPFKAPNPEVPHATVPAREFADRRGAGIVLSSDPDADRIGMEARLQDGSWYHFDGNQIAAILCHHLMLDPHGPRRRGLVMETLVTTRLLGRVATEAGGSWLVDDLLVGFKYVADVLKTLERTGRYRDIACAPQDLVLAAEESHGVVMAPGIRDKDATPACMVLARLYQRLRDEGRTMLDYYVAMLRELGGYDNVNRSIVLAGAEGTRRKDRIMAALRQSPPTELGERPVQRFVDYWDPERFGAIASETDRLPRNVLQAHTDRFVITVRPSGTEPKLKLYCQVLPDGAGQHSGGDDLLPGAAGADAAAAAAGLHSGGGDDLLQQVRAKADALARIIYNELLSCIDVALDEAALLLPDIIDLDGKQRFGQEIVPRLHDAVKRGEFADLDKLLGWLRREAAALTPAADPLPALKPALAALCRQWRDEPGMTLAVELEGWAKGAKP